MAADIGTITVAIEAQTEELTRGLAKAERAVIAAAKNMEGAQANTASLVKKSWTEMASKISVVERVGEIAKQVFDSIDDAVKIMGDDTASAGKKINSMVDMLEGSGIPVVSQFVSIGKTIGGWIFDIQSAEEAIASLNNEMRRGVGIMEEHQGYADQRDLVGSLEVEAELAEAAT